MKSNDFQNLLQSFFLKWMMSQKKVSPSTIQTYKDTFRMLLRYMHEEHDLKASSINMEAINADAIIGFLHYLESSRKNSYKTINNRLAAIKSFMEYVSYECPEYSGTVRKIKAIPFRKVEKKEISYLTKMEIDSLLNVCETKKPEGRRDYLMLLLLYNSGMRVSEMISIQGKDAHFSDNGKCHLRIMGKGRKERVVPLWRTTTNCLSDFMHENGIQDTDYLLSGRNVKHLTRSGVRYRIECIVKKAVPMCLSLKKSQLHHMSSDIQQQ